MPTTAARRLDGDRQTAEHLARLDRRDTVDPWAGVLGHLEMTGVFYSTSSLTAPWGIDLPALPRAVIFHLLLSGEAVVEVEGESHRLVAGDLLVVPHGSGHRILSEPGASALALWDI